MLRQTMQRQSYMKSTTILMALMGFYFGIAAVRLLRNQLM